MPVDVFPFRPEHRSLVQEIMGRSGHTDDRPDAEMRLQRFLDLPHDYCDAVVIGRAAGGADAMALVPRQPALGGEGRSVSYVMPDLKGEVATELVTAIDAVVAQELARRGISKQILFVTETTGYLRPVAEASPYVYHDDTVFMSWDGAPPCRERPVAGVELEFYEGGDALTDHAISELVIRSFAADPLFPALPPEFIAERTALGTVFYATAREQQSGHLVGVAEMTSYGMFERIAVARRHWGTGLADWLAAAMCNEMVRRGHKRLFSSVRSTNWASFALHERMGWKSDETAAVYVRDTGAR